MFYRGNIQRRKLLKPRSHKKKKVNQPEWDNTTQDLTVHAASPEEVLRRQIRHKSKNADAARRELIAKKRGIPIDLVLSPGQIDLEMKKLAILREVLYDQNDFNEVLRKTDQTMASVKNIFHDSAARKSGHPNITLAPGSRLPPPVHPDVEQPSKLDALSDSVMDSKALNDQSPEESEYEDDVQFESKVDYQRFMSLLKDSMSNQREKSKPDINDVDTTPEKGPPVPSHGALNCTEEVKRTLSRISSIKDAEEETKRNDEEKRKIDEVIHGISTIRKDASKLQKNLNNSKATITSALPLPNHTQSNMSYDELQGAMANVQNRLKEFETRTGRTSEQAYFQPSSGLAGFTVTLIDSVTRLTTYVNEGELRTQKLEKSFAVLQNKLAEQVKVNEALAVELVNTQRVIEKDQQEINSLRTELEEIKSRDSEKWKNDFEDQLKHLSKEIEQLEDKVVITENTMTEAGDSFVADEVKRSRKQNESQIEDQGHVQVASTSSSKDHEEYGLKNDMVKLLTALKTENSKGAATQPIPSGFALPQMMDNTQEAARTIASVESHLRHLQLQHAEAQQRMNELTKQAQMHAVTSSNSYGSTISGSVSPCFSSKTSSMASLPIQITAAGTKMPMQQSNILPVFGSSTFELLQPSQNQLSSPEDHITVATDSLDSAKNIMAVDFPEFESESASFKLLGEDSDSSQSLMSSVLSSPHMVEQQQVVLNSIQRTQTSLEDRISELNRQHCQAQERLQKLVTRRKSEKAREQLGKKVQISLPSDDMLATPKQTTFAV